MAAYDNEIVSLSDDGHLLTMSQNVEENDSENYADSTHPVVYVTSSHGSNGATQPLTGGESTDRSYGKIPSYLPLAVIALVLSPPFGLPALLLACLALRAAKRGADLDLVRSRSQQALWLSITGLAVSLVAVIFILVYVFVITPNIVRSFDFLEGIHGNGDLNPARLANFSLRNEIWNGTFLVPATLTRGNAV